MEQEINEYNFDELNENNSNEIEIQNSGNADFSLAPNGKPFSQKKNGTEG